jgi:superfamily I DNA/RNA helicase
MFDMEIDGFDIAAMANSLAGKDDDSEEGLTEKAEQQAKDDKDGSKHKIEPNEFMKSIIDRENEFKKTGEIKSEIIPPKKPAKREWSEQQKAIFEQFKDRSSGHITIIARAGSSKTTTSIEGGRHAPESKIVYAAFGNAIAKELSERLPNDRCMAQTTHSMGWGIIKSIKRKAKLDKSCSFTKIEKAAEKYFNLKENQWDYEAKEYIKDNSWHPAKIYDLVRQCKPYAQYVEEIIDVAIDFDLFTINIENSKPKIKRSVSLIEQVCNVVLAVMEDATEQAICGDHSAEFLCDFTDMIWLPVRCGWVSPRYPLVVIDEAQDLSFTQIELASGMCSGRIILVGDDKQAIYGWRGADSDSLNRMTNLLGSTVMYLTTCYRCAKSIVRYAQRYVPDIHPWEHSPEGEVHQIGPDKMIREAAPGDFVVCRNNAPLMSACLRLITAGKKAMMAGNDIGKKLLKILSDVEGHGKNKNPFVNNDDLWQRLIAWGIQEKSSIEEMVKRKFPNSKPEKIEKEVERRLEVVRDQLGMFSVMKKKFSTPEEVKRQLTILFEDDGEKRDRSKYILCSSVHKAKGLEAKNVFVMADQLKTSSQEEVNICYVAVTRAQERLFMVYENVQDEDDEIEDARDIDRSWSDVKKSRPEIPSSATVLNNLPPASVLDNEKDAEIKMIEDLKSKEDRFRVDGISPTNPDPVDFDDERYNHFF